MKDILYFSIIYQKQHAAALQPEKPGLFGTEVPDSKQSSEANLSDEQGNYGMNELYGICNRINELGERVRIFFKTQQPGSKIPASISTSP
jgi:hypothetical protein